MFIDYVEGVPEKTLNLWEKFFNGGLMGTTLMVLPFYILLLCTLLPQIEYRNNTWKQVLSSPQNKLNIYISKFITIQLFIVLFLFFLHCLMLLMAVSVELINPKAGFSQFALDWDRLFRNGGKIYVGILGVSAFQFWMGMRFKNFITSLAIGLGFWFVTVMFIFDVELRISDMMPFAFAPMLIHPTYADIVVQLLLSSVGYTVVFLTVGYLDFRKFKLNR
jgi:hypothetical protein